MGSVQIEIVKPLDTGIIEIDVDNSIVINRPQVFGIGPE
jgi:hypothetical protein